MLRCSVLVCVAFVVASLPARAQQPQRLKTEKAEIVVETVARGLDHPWGLTFLPDGRMLVTERPGRLRIVSTDGQVSPPLGGVPRVYVRDQGGLLDVALDPKFCNVGKTRGGQAGLKRVRTRSGRYGMAGWSGTASLVPRWFQNDTPSFWQVFIRLKNTSRQSRPMSLRVPPLTLRRVTWARMSFSDPLVCSGISGRSSTRRSSGLLACNRASSRSRTTKPVRRPNRRSNRARSSARRRRVGSRW